jgi:hypothetical protein
MMRRSKLRLVANRAIIYDFRVLSQLGFQERTTGVKLSFKIEEIGTVAMLVILAAYAFLPVPLYAAEPLKALSEDSNVGSDSTFDSPLKIGVGGCQALEAQKERALALASGFKFKMEREAGDNSIVLSLKIPGDVEIAFDQFVKICRSSTLQVQKSIQGLDRWLENGCKNLDKAAYNHNPSVFTNPMVTSATRYCSHPSVAAAADAPVKTVAQR